MAAQLQTRIERIPSGLRRIIITIVVLVILAFLFPLSDDDRRREPNGAELLIPTLAETLTTEASTTTESAPATEASTATVSVTVEPSETSESQATSPSVANTAPAATARPTTTSREDGTTPRETNTNTPTPTPRATQTSAMVCTPSPKAGWEIYTVRRGDTLQGIARLVEASIDELIEANCLENPDHITAGQQLWAPALPDPFATLTLTPRPLVTPTSAG